MRKIVFGDTPIPAGVGLGMKPPQTETAVWLHGLGDPIDVTFRHSIACANPFTICIAFEKDRAVKIKDRNLRLKFCRRDDRERVLGEMVLEANLNVPLGNLEAVLFTVRKSRNYCLPAPRLWAYDLSRTWVNWRRTDASALKMSIAGMRAMAVMFIRPHLVALASLRHDAGGNLFPVNLMGDLGEKYFAFALVEGRAAALGVERAGRIALSSAPFSQERTVYKLAPNHFRAAIDWAELPFALRPSNTFHIPVPVFARRVRELEVLSTRRLGSHRLFLARTVAEEKLEECEELYIVEGYFQAWRIRKLGAA
jgi:hypothetical protein